MLRSVPSRFLAVLVCMVLFVSAAAAEDVSVILTADVSACRPGEEITLTGEILHQGTDLGGTLLQMTAETDPATEGISRPLITALNGEELDADWQDSELVLLEEETLGDLFRFSGKWTVPEDADFHTVKISLKVICADDSEYTASCGIENVQPVITMYGLTVLQLAAILAAVIAVICGIWFLLHRRKDQPEAIPENGKGGRVLDTVIILLFFFGWIITPVLVRVPFVYLKFPALGSLCHLNFPCTLALLLSFLRLKKWTAADLMFFAAWMLLLIPMCVSNRELHYTRYVVAPFQNLLPVYFIFYRMNNCSREKTIRLFMILFNSFIFILLAFAIEEAITKNAAVIAFRDWLVEQNMYAQEFVRFADNNRFFSFWGHPLTSALLFNCFLALNTAWYKSRGKKIYALLYFPAALAGVLFSGSKTGITVCFLFLIVICWEHKKWFLVCIPILAAVYFTGAFNAIIARFAKGSLTTGRIEALTKFFSKWYSEYPFQWLNGYGSNTVLASSHDLFPMRAGFEFPLLMFAMDYGIVFSVVLMAGSYLYMTWRCLKKRQWTIWLCLTLVFAEINTYNGFSLRNQDIFTLFYFIVMVILNMLPNEAAKPSIPQETTAITEQI